MSEEKERKIGPRRVNKKFDSFSFFRFVVLQLIVFCQIEERNASAFIDSLTTSIKNWAQEKMSKKSPRSEVFFSDFSIEQKLEFLSFSACRRRSNWFERQRSQLWSCRTKFWRWNESNRRKTDFTTEFRHDEIRQCADFHRRRTTISSKQNARSSTRPKEKRISRNETVFLFLRNEEFDASVSSDRNRKFEWEIFSGENSRPNDFSF